MGEIGATFNGLTGKTKVDFGEGMPYVQYMQIFSNSKINVEEFGLVKIEVNENQSKVQYGDVFFTTSSETPNEIGTASVMLEDVGDVYLNSFCFGFRPNSLTELVPQFSRYLFRSELFRREIIKLAQGSTRFNMSKVELMKLRVLLPKEDEQNKIANFLTSLDDSIESIGVEIDGSIEYKKGLLQKCLCDMELTKQSISNHSRLIPGIEGYLTLIDKIEENKSIHPDIAIETCKSLLEGLCLKGLSLLSDKYINSKSLRTKCKNDLKALTNTAFDEVYTDYVESQVHESLANMLIDISVAQKSKTTPNER